MQDLSVAQSDGGVSPGEGYLEETPLLRTHAGTQPDLFLRWNRIPISAQTLDVVVHLHGFSQQGGEMPLAEKVTRSGLDLSGRTRPTLAMLPRGNWIRHYYYDFPALLSGGIDRLVDYGVTQFSRVVASAAPGAAGSFAVDRFNQWLSVDSVTGDINASFYDTRNDTTGARYMTDVYFTQSTDGGSSWLSPNVRVTTESSSEHDCDGLFPCPGIDYGNQYGDYEGLVSYGGVSHPVWTESRRQLEASAGCKTNLAMEEVFSATVE